MPRDIRMMTESEILQRYRDAGIIFEGHFVYTSGRHGNLYVDKRELGELIEELCEQIAIRVISHEVEVVVSPEHGATEFGRLVAAILSELFGKEVPFVSARKGDDGFFIEEGVSLRGKWVLMVEDILTTGESIRKAVNVVRNRGGEIIAVAALFNRGRVTSADIGDVPELISLVNFMMESWSAGECPLCHGDAPVAINTERGHGAEFLAARET